MFPVLYSKSLLAIYFIHSSLYNPKLLIYHAPSAPRCTFYIQQVLYPSVCQLAFGLPLHPDHWKRCSMNTKVHVSFWTSVIFPEYVLRSRNAGPSIIYTFSFIDTVKQFWKWLYKYIFLLTVWAFRFYIYLICPVFFIFAILVGMGWHLILVFICISLMTNEV